MAGCQSYCICHTRLRSDLYRPIKAPTASQSWVHEMKNRLKSWVWTETRDQTIRSYFSFFGDLLLTACSCRLKTKAPKNRATDRIRPESRLLWLLLKVAPSTSTWSIHTSNTTRMGGRFSSTPKLKALLHQSDPLKVSLHLALTFWSNLREQNMNCPDFHCQVSSAVNFRALRCQSKFRWIHPLPSYSPLSQFFARINQIHLRGFTTE